MFWARKSQLQAQSPPPATAVPTATAHACNADARPRSPAVKGAASRHNSGRLRCSLRLRVTVSLGGTSRTSGLVRRILSFPNDCRWLRGPIQSARRCRRGLASDSTTNRQWHRTQYMTRPHCALTAAIRARIGGVPFGLTCFGLTQAHEHQAQVSKTREWSQLCPGWGNRRQTQQHTERGKQDVSNKHYSLRS